MTDMYLLQKTAAYFHSPSTRIDFDSLSTIGTYYFGPLVKNKISLIQLQATSDVYIQQPHVYSSKSLLKVKSVIESSTKPSQHH